MRRSLAIFATVGLLLAAPGIDYARAKRFWSFRPIEARAVPAVRDTVWGKSTIDRFILRKLEDKGLKPAPPAGRATLLRRVTFDVTGLPPTVAELDAFLADRSPQAYERVVDRLLASPHYGERWARHWLDLVRFAETDGHEFDNDKPDMWRYRDYVVRAFNADVAYPQFVREHIAGDLLGAPRRSADGNFVESPMATAYYWLGENKNSPVDSVESIAERVDSQIDVFGKAFLGLTIACARCHDHKFDPIATADYYSLAGFFHSVRRGQLAVDGAVPRNEAGLPTAGFTWSVAGPAFALFNGRLTSGSISPVRQGVAYSNIFTLQKRYVHVRTAGTAGVKLMVDEYPLTTYNGTDREFKWYSYDVLMYAQHPAYVALIDQDSAGHVTLGEVVFSDDAKPPVREIEIDLAAGNLVETCPEPMLTLAPVDDAVADTRIHVRGSHKTLGAPAPRRFLPVIAGLEQASVTRGSGRLDLADRLTDEANPLLARVMVNRFWQHHFGRGIVSTPDNFGATGEPPTHPELLDWLAMEYRSSGWSAKHMHRLMLLTKAYQMSSGGEAQDTDPANKYLYRFPVQRLEAEAIRDHLLAVSGSLDLTMAGPSVPVYVSAFMDGDARGKPKSGPVDGRNRRSLYINVRRNYLPDSLTIFDYPQPISTLGKRNVSVVPTQALYLMNSEFVQQQAARWAERVRHEPDPVRTMYREAFSRPPSAAEVTVAREFLKTQPLESYAHALMQTAEFLFIR